MKIEGWLNRGTCATYRSRIAALRRNVVPIFLLLIWSLAALAQTPGADPLPDWNEGSTKASIINFVEKVTL
jgi:hypothetical protein